MSELAFDVMGEPVEFPEATEELRVRRFRNPGMRGACELVHDRDGAPLYVPVDTGYLEFRAMVEGVPGRYRLDPVGQDRRGIPGAVPAYVSIAEVRNAAKSETSEQESVIRELARANAEMVKTMAEKFADVMRAAAELLRAADGAGLTRRAPTDPQPRNGAGDEDDREDEEEDDDDLEEDNEEEETPDIAKLIAQMMPMLQMWLATKAAPNPVATAQPAAPVETTPPPNGSTEVPRNGMPSPAQQVHLLAIYNKLDPTEQRITERVVKRMSPDVRAEWLEELCALTADEAVARVRSMIPGRGSAKDAPSEDATGDSGAVATPEPGVGVPTAAAQLMAIHAALEPHERQIVEQLARSLSPDLRAKWLEQVCAMPTAEAVALVRSLIPSNRIPAAEGPGGNGSPRKEGR